MPIQPINYANIPLLRGPFHDLDFGQMLRQGMELGQYPGKLQRERQREELKNRMMGEQYEQLRALTPYAGENAQNAALENRVRAQFAHPNAEAALTEALNRGKLTGEQARWFGPTAQSKIGLTQADIGLKGAQQRIIDATAALPPSYRMDTNNPVQAYYTTQQFAAENQGNPDIVREVAGQIQQHQQYMGEKHLPQQERDARQLQRVYSELNNPNTPEQRKAQLRPIAAKYENQMEKIAMGPQVYDRMKRGGEMQDLIKEALTPRYIGRDKKTGKAVWGNTPVQDAVMFSGPVAWTQKDIESLRGTKDYQRYKAAQDLMSRINHLYTNFEGLSVQPGAEAERGKLLSGESLKLFPEAAAQNLTSYLNRMTRGHQLTLDKAREDAGLPMKPTDVNGRWRQVAQPEYYQPQNQANPSISNLDRHVNASLPPVDYNEYIKGNR